MQLSFLRQEYFDYSNNFVYFEGVIRFRWMPFLVLSLSLMACLGRDYRGGIMRYEQAKVFRITPLPTPWKGPKLRYKEMIHENDTIGGTIVTDALCGPKFEDTPLEMLAKHLFYKLERPQMRPHRYFQLAGRDAIRVEGMGSIDGVPLQMAVVVLKKNHCVYDFVYFAPPNGFDQGVSDFENYYQSLQAP